MFSGLNIGSVFMSVLVLILILTGAYFLIIYSRLNKYISSGMKVSKTRVGGNKVKSLTGDAELDKAIETAGYSYDQKQDIFYSNMDAWQRNMGYCRLYDEAAAPFGMIVDCEPIYFEYEEKKWLIEFWKGQYDLTTGCEIGVYTSAGPDLNINGLFNGTFYNCASDEERLQMSLILKKNGKTLFTRKGKHWWLTGFKLGEFSDPSELTIDLIITLKDKKMRNAFLKGLKMAGYLKEEIIVEGNVVGLKFNKPRTSQPISRITKTDWIIQRKNKLLCDNYQDITKSYNNFPDKIRAIQEQAPGIYEKIIKIGNNEHLYRIHEKIKDYLT
jgi:hypothetical protein